MTAIGFRPAQTASIPQVLRPFLLLAGAAFVIGFGGYLIVAEEQVMRAQDAARPVAAAAPAPMAAVTAAEAASEPVADDWNTPKKI